VAKRNYGQYCPVARTAEIVADRWTPLIIRELLAGIDGFNTLHRSLPGISRSILAERLRRLEHDGIITRHAGSAGRMTTYQLTPAGQDLQLVISGMAAWGFRWAFGDPRPEEQDPWLLLWWMRRRVNAAALPDRRIVVQFDFSGGWTGSYWLLIEPADVTICLHHPGFDIDLLVRADVGILYRVWLGQLSLTSAQRAGQIEVDGPPSLARAFATRWFVWSPFPDAGDRIDHNAAAQPSGRV
jgi:DNA-binding HxlR family transcriptional regulator